MILAQFQDYGVAATKILQTDQTDMRSQSENFIVT
jgi:hypothetical protein